MAEVFFRAILLGQHTTVDSNGSKITSIILLIHQVGSQSSIAFHITQLVQIADSLCSSINSIL